MTVEKVLIVDDEPMMLKYLSEALSRQGIEVTVAESGEAALQIMVKQNFDMVITDLKLGGMTGMEVLKKIKEVSPTILVMIMTAFGTIENAVEAMKQGAFHYLIKPFSIESLMANIEKASQHLMLIAENSYLKSEIAGKKTSTSVVAESPFMKKLMQDIDKIAKSSASVMITGETGSGKEVIAQLIHAKSLRCKAPFIKVNCASLSENLIESEFFGHEKGAYTGAFNKRIGRFELANLGTLLLDEITEIPVHIQASLLRVIQEKEFERVGGTKTISIDVRLISTSNRNLQVAIEEKIFREDLYYRLNVIPIHLEPLRDRKEDIIPLAELFMQQYCIESHQKKKTMSTKVKNKLLSYNWPGNVRELANVIERAVILQTGSKIEDLSFGGLIDFG